MPRLSTHEAAEILAERLINRGHEGSREWIAAWVRRWGSIVARDTESDPLFHHAVASHPARLPEGALDPRKISMSHVRVGVDQIDLNLYREWKDIQDGSRKIVGTMGDAARWED